MRRFFPLLLLCAALPLASAVAEPVSWEEITALPAPPAEARNSYGREPAQFGELRLPSGAGPFPVAVLLHGGCWLAEFDLHHLAPMAAALTRAGFATWSLEYRRLGDPGGGWPGTFEDVAAGVDRLRSIAKEHPLDLERVIFIGHSAGGQLALWAAGTVGEKVAGPMRPKLRPRGVVALAAVADLRTYFAGPGGCNAAVERLLGGTPSEMPTRYRTASPIESLPLRVPSRLIHGELDPIVPLEQSRSFVAQAKAAGDNSELHVMVGAGHFDFLQPTAPAFATVLRAAQELVQLAGKPK